MCIPRTTFYILGEAALPGLVFCGYVLANLASWIGMIMQAGLVQ